MEVIRAGIHGFYETLGLDKDEIRLYWVLHTESEHQRQAAYRVEVAADRGYFDAEPQEGTRSVWDSGRVEGDAQRNILCKPRDGFASTTMHYWRVTVWDQDGNLFSSPLYEFYTAYPRSSRLLPPYSMNQTYMPHTSLIFRTWFEDEPNRWKAVWLGNGGDKPIYLRKAFHLQRKVARCIVFASGLGHFNLTVNGQPGSNHRIDPGWTDYHQSVQYVGYDVTNLLAEGENVLGSHVGNGFYAGDQGDRFFWPNYEDLAYVRYSNELAFMAEIHVHYEDGTHETIISDPTWKVRTSATTLANIYSSETHDKRLIPLGWDAPGFDDSEWPTAKPLTGPRGKLRYQSQPPVVLHNTFEPVKRTVIREGAIVFDLGQNSTIATRAELRGAAGATVLVRHSETIGDDGAVLMPDPLFKDFETEVYHKITLAGTGDKEVWEPDFCFTSARYIQLEGVSTAEGDGLPVVASLNARHISSASRQLGFVKTDKEDVNALINACYWTFSSNLHSYHTDCPQIEKFGWLEVTHLLFPATQYVRDIEALHTKILDDIIDTQEPSGLVPTMAPRMRYMCGPLNDTITWGCAACFIPEQLKRYYGSTASFPKIYQPCVRYMEYLATKERRGGLIEHGLGDWGRDIAFGNHQANIETAVYYRCLRNVAMMAAELGHSEDEKRFSAWADRVRDVYNRHLLVTDKKEHPYAFYTSLDSPDAHDRTMVAQAMALQFELVPAEHRADVIAAFLADAEASGFRMQAGEIGLKYLWDVLALPEVDRPDIVLAMARQEEHPSYMRFLRRGETTLLEFWQDLCRSKCHDMLGTIYEWFYAAVLGVAPAADAWRAWTLRPPYRSEFDFAEGEVDAPYGLVKVRFDRRARTDGKVALDVTVPTGTTCTLSLPGPGSTAVAVRKGTDARRELSGKEVQLAQGSYTLEIQP